MTEPCNHRVISNEANVDGSHGFRCESCGERIVLRTKKGTILTPDDIDRFVTEAEVGYDTSKIKERQT